MKTQEMQTRLDEVRSRLVELGDMDELSDEEAREFDELDTEETELREAVEAAERREQRAEELRQIQEATRTVAGQDVTETSSRTEKKVWDLDTLEREWSTPEKTATELRARVADAIGEARGLTDEQRDTVRSKLDRLGIDDDAPGYARTARHIVAVSSPEYTRDFSRMLRQFARTGAVSVPDTVQRAMSLTDAAGGFAVPLPVDPTLILNDDGSVNPFRQISTVRPATGDSVRTVNSTAVSASWDGEAGEVSDDATTFANIDVSIHKAQAFVPFSIEISQDYPGFQEDIRMLFADARDNLEATAFATGSGSSQPFGIVTALTGGSFEISSNTTDTFALGDVYDLEEELPARFRNSAVWVANKRIYQAMREAGGANLDDFWANLGQGQPNELLGYPAFESSEMDGTINATADNRVLVFGDFSNYRIYDRVGLSVELVPHLFATANNRPSGQRGLYAYWRVGADSVNDRAFRLLNVT